jgi:NAD(P)-dependent dehydrogenase (short-subunit alcohol dehydrogenase family)
VQKALPLMPDGASIVINGSMTSIKGTPAFGVYAATKAALRSFARTWSVDLQDRKIRVNVVSPGTVITPGYTNALGLSDEQIEQIKAQTAAAAPLGRAGTPDEIAKGWYSWLRMTAAMSPASSCSSTAAWRKSECA